MEPIRIMRLAELRLHEQEILARIRKVDDGEFRFLQRPLAVLEYVGVTLGEAALEAWRREHGTRDLLAGESREMPPARADRSVAITIVGLIPKDYA